MSSKTHRNTDIDIDIDTGEVLRTHVAADQSIQQQSQEPRGAGQMGEHRVVAMNMERSDGRQDCFSQIDHHT